LEVTDNLSNFALEISSKHDFNQLKRELGRAKVRKIKIRTMIQKKKILVVPKNCIVQIAKAHGCTKTTVYNALAMRSMSDLALAIRNDAEKNYPSRWADKIYF